MYVANTDYGWFRNLASLASSPAGLDEANFWRPSGKQVVKYLEYGNPFVFKLRAEHGHKIVGFGSWVSFARLSIAEAWSALGSSNGYPSLPELWTAVTGLAASQQTEAGGYQQIIGCDLIASPVFFPDEMWVDSPRNWAGSIVSGKGYSMDGGEGLRIWQECLATAELLNSHVPIGNRPASEPEVRFGKGQVVYPRLGQGTFRFGLQRLYGRCAVSQEHSLPALDAAHIIPYGQEGGTHSVRNGLLLRADIHRLYDAGYVAVTPDYEFRVSGQLRDDFDNGKVYYRLEEKMSGRKIWTPADAQLKPDPSRLEVAMARFRGV
ncbi:MAG: HNH endonuclease [Bacteroidota bacterium]